MKETLSRMQESIQILKSEVQSLPKWQKLLKMKVSKNTKGCKSAFEILSMTNDGITFAQLAKALPHLLGHLDEDSTLATRLEV